MKLPFVHFDCTHFRGDRPCYPNKQFGVFCDDCSYFEKREDVDLNDFPAIQLPDNEFNNIKNILIIKLDAIGDVLRTTSILPSLRERFKDCRITWLTKDTSKIILEHNNQINKIITAEEFRENSHSEDNFDAVFNLDSGVESCTIMNSVKARYKFGYEFVNKIPYPVNELANEWYLMGINDEFKKQNKKTYHRLIHEISGLNYSQSKPSLSVFPSLGDWGVDSFEKFILVNLGGGNRWQFKKWTRQGYVDLINRLAAEKPAWAIGVVAGNDDRSFYEEVIKNAGSNSNILKLGCDNSVEDFINMIAASDKVFTSDSLAFHIASALGKYVVVIVGPTSASELDAFGSGEIIYSDKMECLCCYLNKCDKIINCMNTVSVDKVIEYLV